MNKKIGITEVVLRDESISLSTRLKLEDIIPIASKLDDIGYPLLRVGEGLLILVRYLDEDPWERLRELKAMPKTKQQMLLRGQNLPV